jgi:uncharacterized membrane protein YvbJ
MKVSLTYCSKCGSSVPNDARYCPSCGSAVDNGEKEDFSRLSVRKASKKKLTKLVDKLSAARGSELLRATSGMAARETSS